MAQPQQPMQYKKMYLAQPQKRQQYVKAQPQQYIPPVYIKPQPQPQRQYVKAPLPPAKESFTFTFKGMETVDAPKIELKGKADMCVMLNKSFNDFGLNIVESGLYQINYHGIHPATNERKGTKTRNLRVCEKGCFKDKMECIYTGCMDEAADNYNSNANIDDRKCIFTGCTNKLAINYEPKANKENKSCLGCMDTIALNYNSKVHIDDGSCQYAVDEYGQIVPANQRNGLNLNLAGISAAALQMLGKGNGLFAQLYPFIGLIVIILFIIMARRR